MSGKVCEGVADAVQAAFRGEGVVKPLGSPWDPKRRVEACGWEGPVETWCEAIREEAQRRADSVSHVKPVPGGRGWRIWQMANAVASVLVAGDQGAVTLRGGGEVWISALCEAALRPSFPPPGWTPGPWEAAS